VSGVELAKSSLGNLGYHWWYYINFFHSKIPANESIIIGSAFAVILASFPETQLAIVTAKAAAEDSLAKIGQRKSSLDAAKEIYFIASIALKILFTEQIVAFLVVFRRLAYGHSFLLSW
jgi:hypothetical protein